MLNLSTPVQSDSDSSVLDILVPRGRVTDQFTSSPCTLDQAANIFLPRYDLNNVSFVEKIYPAPHLLHYIYADYNAIVMFGVFILILSWYILYGIISTVVTDVHSGECPYSYLKDLRIKNVDKIIFGQININSIRYKFDLFADLVKNKIDILLISETKLDCTFPKSQFRIQGYSAYRLDRTSTGGGLLLFIRADIPVKPLPLLLGGIECLISEITISKKKWILVGTYNPNKSMISSHLDTLGKNLSHYLSSYDNVILLGDLNSEVKEEAMSEFCSIFNLTSLIKKPTCFKNPENPSCIDLILTNRPHSFQNSYILESELSDFH